MDIMLTAPAASILTELDHLVFNAIVPQDHYLCQVLAAIDFERFRPKLSDCYSATMGRPPIDPVRMLKIMFLRFHYKLSDRQVIVRSRTDLAFRSFLGLGMNEHLPNHTNGTHFRQRIGPERFEQIFQELVALAREHGLVNDRLRLKDATHIFADADDVRPLQLAAQVRELLLAAAAAFFADWVSAQRVLVDALRQATVELADAERLARRVAQLRDMAVQLRELAASLPAVTQPDGKRQRLNRALAVVAKLLEDRADPKAGDRLASAFDNDARVGKHGEFYLGFMVDMAMDPDSEIITALNVLPANGAEAADAITLIEKEETAQGNDVQGISIDGAGYIVRAARKDTFPKTAWRAGDVSPPVMRSHRGTNVPRSPVLL
jgi:transposase